jgi:glycosyltransferase involved in cell wall biosynthesis
MKVSVIIPCYNAEAYIPDCIKSIEKQTYRDLEVICVNDGSSDQTKEVLEDLISSSSLSIKLFDQENNGAPSARNNGLTHSTGAYIQFLDADDLLTPNKIEHQIELATKSNFPAIIVGSYQRQNLKEEILSRKKYVPNASENLWLRLMKTDLGITSSNLFKSDLFKDDIKWNEKLKSSQEYELMFQVLKKYSNLVFDPEINTIIRVRDTGSISQTNIGSKWEGYVQLRVDIIEYLQKSNPSVIDSDLIHALFTCLRLLYPHNPQKTIALFQKYIPKGFAPPISNATGKGYVLLYKLFGFRITERIRQYMTKNKAN